MFKKLNEEKGFTLVELLIVIAILAVLAVAAAPKFISYRQQANANTCKNNQSTIETAAEQWMFDNTTATAYPAVSGLTAQLKSTPACPSNGAYSISTGGVVSCSGATGTGTYGHARTTASGT
jgi:type IV pilus assembly protein PilA